jgi:RHS repeat-associated protein
VGRGDTVNVSAWARLEATANNFALNIIPLSIGGLLGSPEGSIFAGGMKLLLAPQFTSTSASSTPRAYVKVAFVDEQGNIISQHYRTIEKSTSWHEVKLGITAPTDCYAVIFVANESPVNVYFDNIEVSHPHLVVSQETHYYPFGLEIKPLAREGGNRWKYNGKELEAETKWSDYGARHYDAQIGRFHKIDRFAEKYYDLTPYHYCANNPIRYVDVNGDSIFITVGGKHYTLEEAIKASDNGEFGGIDSDENQGIINLLQGFATLNKTEDGQALLSGYSSDAEHDIYLGVASSDLFLKAGEQSAAALTHNTGKIKEGNLVYNETHTDANGAILKSLQPFDIFSAPVRNKNNKNDFIVFNNRYLLGRGFWAESNKYDWAETLYHEVTAHIAIRDANNGQLVRPDGTSISYHRLYGASNNMLKLLKPLPGTPADRIHTQLLYMRNLNAKNGSDR